MLDTNIVSNAFRFPDGQVARRLLSVDSGECCLSIISLAELRFGAAKVRSNRLGRKIDEFLLLASALPFQHPAELAYAEIRARLEANGTPISPNDMLIAAHALTLDLTLVTANTSEFSRVPNLRLDNWLA